MTPPTLQDLIKFRMFCIYIFVERHHAASAQVYNLFSRFQLNDSIDADYEVLHSQSTDNIYDSLLSELKRKGWGGKFDD